MTATRFLLAVVASTALLLALQGLAPQRAAADDDVAAIIGGLIAGYLTYELLDSLDSDRCHWRCYRDYYQCAPSYWYYSPPRCYRYDHYYSPPLPRDYRWRYSSPLPGKLYHDYDQFRYGDSYRWRHGWTPPRNYRDWDGRGFIEGDHIRRHPPGHLW